MLYGTTLAAPFGLRREIDKLFDEVMTGGGRRMSWAPVVDIQEDAKEIAIVAELPGLKPDQVEVTCENGVLNIRGEKSEERKEDDQSRHFHVWPRCLSPKRSRSTRDRTGRRGWSPGTAPPRADSPAVGMKKGESPDSPFLHPELPSRQCTSVHARSVIRFGAAAPPLAFSTAQEE